MSYSLSNISVSTMATMTNNGTLTLPTSSGTYTITTTGYGGGGGTSLLTSSGTGWANSISTITDSSPDVVIRMANGKEIHVGSLLEQITELLMIIPDNADLHSKNPALKDAYDHHQLLVKELLSNSKVRESYDSYNTLRKLVQDDDQVDI